MKNLPTGPALALLLAATLVACSSTRPTTIDEPATMEGLQRVDVKGIDAVYRKPGTDFGRYRRLLMRDVDISFSRGWEDNHRSAAASWSRVDSERIRRELAELFMNVARQELQDRGGYELVTEAAPDVLEIRPSIVDLYINAPDLSRDNPGIIKSYTTDAGRMTLVAELRDSITGEILARAYDKREDMRSQTWQWTTSVTNSQKARLAIQGWARALREALDGARSGK
jgi:hypothetical protein